MAWNGPRRLRWVALTRRARRSADTNREVQNHRLLRMLHQPIGDGNMWHGKVESPGFMLPGAQPGRTGLDHWVRNAKSSAVKWHESCQFQPEMRGGKRCYSFEQVLPCQQRRIPLNKSGMEALLNVALLRVDVMIVDDHPVLGKRTLRDPHTHHRPRISRCAHDWRHRHNQEKSRRS